MRSFLLGFVMTACGSAAEVPMTPSNQVAPARGGPPDLAELRDRLSSHRREAFSSASVTDRACSVTPTFGEYVDLLDRADDPTKKVTGGCREFRNGDRRSVDPPFSREYWWCEIDAIEGEGTDALWHYELIVRVRKSDRSIELATAGCPGTP